MVQKKELHHPNIESLFSSHLSAELKRRGDELGLSGIDCGTVARNVYKKWESGIYYQSLTGAQIKHLIAIDQADPAKKETSPIVLDRQFGQRLRKKRTGSRRG